jgi:glycosyltransferase involved in cell wall biosynthesis
MPEVSVLMAVRNGVPWVSEAIASVLGQSLTDIELVVVDDGSTDATGAVLAGIRDPRVVVERVAQRGLTRALCRAAALARAPVLARLDADDVADGDRLARQVAYLRAHPAVGLVGGAAREVDPSGKEVRVVRPPTDDATLRRRLIRDNPFVHSSVTMRRAAYDRAGGYDPAVAVAQDYDLWMRMSAVTELANLTDVVVVRRLVAGRVTAARDGDRLRTEVHVRWRALRDGRYPWSAIVHVLRPALALALPPPLRRAVRLAVFR